MTRRLLIPVLFTASCLEPPPLNDTVCLDFISENLTQAPIDASGVPQSGLPRVGEDVRFEWWNRVVRVGDIDVDVTPVDERIEISGKGTTSAVVSRTAGIPPESQPGDPRSLDLSALLGVESVSLPAGEYTVTVVLDDDNATGHHCLGIGQGQEEAEFAIQACACEGVYESVDLRLQNVALDPLVPLPGQDFQITWENTIDSVDCLPKDGVSGRFIEQITLAAIDGPTYGPIERPVGAFLYNDVSSRSINISEFYRGIVPPPGDYQLTIELDPTGIVPECVTPDDEIDYANNTQTHLLTVPARN